MTNVDPDIQGLSVDVDVYRQQSFDGARVYSPDGYRACTRSALMYASRCPAVGTETELGTICKSARVSIGVSRMKYEYKIEQFKEKGFVNAEVKWQHLEDRLNTLGAEGWDIQEIQPISLGSGQSGVIVFLKRQVS